MTFYAQRACYSRIFCPCLFCGWVVSRLIVNFSGLTASVIGMVGHFLTQLNLHSGKMKVFFGQILLAVSHSVKICRVSPQGIHTFGVASSCGEPGLSKLYTYDMPNVQDVFKPKRTTVSVVGYQVCLHAWVRGFQLARSPALTPVLL